MELTALCCLGCVAVSIIGACSHLSRSRLLIAALGLEKTRNIHLISVSYPGSFGGNLSALSNCSYCSNCRLIAASKSAWLGTAGSILNALQAFAASHMLIRYCCNDTGLRVTTRGLKLATSSCAFLSLFS